MSNLRVKGFDYISFWEEDNIGIIAIRIDSKGVTSVGVINELILSLGTAMSDNKITSIAITGINDVFLKGLVWESDKQDFLEVMDSSHMLATILYGIRKPVFSLLNGDCLNFGYELALLTDRIIARPSSNVGFSADYGFMAGGSMTWSRFRYTGTGKSRAGINVDVVGDDANFLGYCKEYINDNQRFDFSTIRRANFGLLQNAIMAETDTQLRNYYRKQLGKEKVISQEERQQPQ